MIEIEEYSTFYKIKKNMIPFKNISPETTYFVLGIGATVIASLTRTIRRKGFFSRIGFFRWIVDAVTCTFTCER